MSVGNKVKGITIEFNGDTTKLDRALRQVKNESKDIDQQLKEVNRSLKFNPRNTELLKQKFEILRQKVDLTEKELREFKNIESQLKAQGVSKNSAEWMKVRRNIIEAESKLKHFNAEMAKVKYANVKALGDAFQTAGQKMRTAGTYASIGAAGAIVAGKKLLELNTTQEQAENKLIEIYKTRMGVNKDAAKSTMELASALQKQGVIGDEVTLSGAQQLATYAKYPSTVNKLLPAMDDLLVQQKGYNATAEDAAGIANLFGKAMMGNVGALRRVGISFTEEQEKVLKYGTEEEKAAMLAQVVTDNVGHMNEVFAETDEGKLQQVKNSLGDIGERLGHMLLPALAEAANWISESLLPKIEKLVSFMEGHPMIAKVAVAITGLLAVGGPLLIFFGALVSAAGTIMSAFGGIVAALGALAGPIGIVVAAVAAAIATGVALYKNWDKIKAKAVAFKDGVVKAFNSLKDSVKRIFGNIRDAITSPIRKAVDTVKRMIEKIKAFFKFKVSLPKIKLPHFAIKPKGWQIGDLLKGSIPHLGISWYADGAIFTKPTVIGNKGFGEAGAEAALPLDALWDHMGAMFAQMSDNIVNGVAMAMRMQSAGAAVGGDIVVPIYLYPSGPKMGEETVKMYDKYKPIIG